MTLTTVGAQAVTKQPTYTLADLRKATGMTQKQIAQRMGVNQPRVSQIEQEYPNLHFQVVSSYIEALGGHVALTGVGGRTIPAADIRARTRDAGAQANRRQRSAQGVKLLLASAAEELPLQEETAQTCDDDTGGQEDHADAQSNQGDRGQAEQR